MKKITLITFIAFLMLSLNFYSQSNITWVVKDKVGKEFFTNHITINTNVTGFESKSQSEVFINQLKATPEVMSAEVSDAEANGNFNLILTMKNTHDSVYYIGLAQKLGVAYIIVNGEKKTTVQLRDEARRDAATTK